MFAQSEQSQTSRSCIFKMDYTRHSSQPATVDLVRADLAEVWTIGEEEHESPKRPPSILGVSDMLDLEYIPTPGLRASKATRKDPLPSLLGDILELSPSRNRERSNPDGRPSPSKPSGKGNKGASHHVQHRNRPAKDSAATALSSPATHPVSPQGSYASTRGTQEPKRPARIQQPPANANLRRRPVQQTEGTRGSPTVSPTPNPRQPRQSNTTQAASSIAPKSSIRASKTRPETSKLASCGTKTKARKRDDDCYELSDATNTDEEFRPKKRQAKQPSPKQPRSPSDFKTRNSGEGSADDSLVISQGNKPTGTKRTRVPKKPSELAAGPEKKIEVEPRQSDTVLHDDTEVELGINKDQGKKKHKSARGKPKIEPRRSPPLESAALKTGSPLEALSPKLPNHSLDSSRKNESFPPAAPEFRDVIIVSSGSEGDAVAGSTSPLFVEQGQQHITSDGPDISVTVDPATSSGQRLPIRLPSNHIALALTPPPSFQPHDFGKRLQTHNVGHLLPAALREAFLSDEQPTVSPSPVPEPNHCLEEEALTPEDIWKQAVEDDSPPAVMRRIVTLLHRSLKPREEVVKDIAADYQENALRLLGNLSARHHQEQADTMSALRKACRDAFSVFSGAGQEIGILISRLREMDVNHTADTLTRPLLVQKLDGVARLCQNRLDGYVKKGSLEDDLESEPEDTLDSLSETYRVKLFEAVRRPDDAPDVSGEVNLQVSEFIKRCFLGETNKLHHPPVKNPEKSTRNANDAPEVFLDGIIGRLEEKSEGAILSRPKMPSTLSPRTRTFQA